MALVLVGVCKPSEHPLPIMCVFPCWLGMLCDTDSECVPLPSLSQPAARVFIEETVETKKVGMREGIPSEGNADLPQLSFLLCCSMSPFANLLWLWSCPLVFFLYRLIQSSEISFLTTYLSLNMYPVFRFTLLDDSSHLSCDPHQIMSFKLPKLRKGQKRSQQ